MTDKNTLAANSPERLPLTSTDMTDALISQLREAAPQIFREGKVDIIKLQAALGEHVDDQPERYGLNWAGKRNAFKNVQVPSVATLRPQFEESVNWDSTENLIIEGDNLEVLKLLQKSYHGRVKMIYIDPPYNTGNEFIYPDNFQEGLDEYLRYTGQLSAEGNATSTNRDTSGRYHSNWLNMMYPRLFLARNLLRDDGIIFVSIDDHEVHNLRLLMDEIFGEENFIANIVWQKKQSPQNDATNVSDMHDHILAYARIAKQSKADKEGWQRQTLPRGEEQEDRYDNHDGDERGAWTSADLTCNKNADERPNLFFAIRHPITKAEIWPSRTRVWGYEKSQIERLISEDKISWGKSGDNFPRLKRFRLEVADGVVPSTWWTREKAGDNQESRREIRSIFPEDDLFDTPKPSRLIRRMLQISTVPGNDELVLDFFAGSGTTAQAVLDQNNEDGGNRKFILVQIPEKTNNSQYPTISQITRERVRRVISRLNKSEKNTLNLNQTNPLDRGFRALKLDTSNFKIWKTGSTPHQADQLAEQLSLYADNLQPDRTEQDRLYEVLLKNGLQLSSQVETFSAYGKNAYSVARGTLVICLEQHITRETLRELFVPHSGSNRPIPQMVLCLDAMFDGNDSLKTNAVLEAQAQGITFKTI